MQFIYSEQVYVLVMKIFPRVSDGTPYHEHSLSGGAIIRAQSEDSVLGYGHKSYSSNCRQFLNSTTLFLIRRTKQRLANKQKIAGFSNLWTHSQRKLRNWTSQVHSVHRSVPACLPTRNNLRIPDRISHYVRNCEILAKCVETFQNIFHSVDATLFVHRRILSINSYMFRLSYQSR